MSPYGDAAVLAARICTQQQVGPVEAWAEAARKVFPGSESQQVKSCPRSTFLALCGEGLVVNVPAGQYTRSKLNRRYALRGVELVRHSDSLAAAPNLLWRTVMDGEAKAANGQMDVVIALWRAGLIPSCSSSVPP